MTQARPLLKLGTDVYPRFIRFSAKPSRRRVYQQHENRTALTLATRTCGSRRPTGCEPSLTMPGFGGVKPPNVWWVGGNRSAASRGALTFGRGITAVSYTHLTLPTKRIV